MPDIDIATATSYLISDLHGCRRAITYRGGEISATAGFREVFEKIATLPVSSTIGTVTDETISSLKIVPQDSINHCYIKSVGGMTYKCENLMPFPYIATEGAHQNIEMGVGTSYLFNENTLTVNADRSITISRDHASYATAVLLNVSVASADYYLTVFKVSSEGDEHISISSNVGSIPFGESVFIPSSTGITKIDLNDSGGEAFSCTLKIVLSKEPYFEGLKDTKTTAIKAYGSNLLDFEAALNSYYWKIPYKKIGESFDITTVWGKGFNPPYQFTDIPGICTISVSSSTTSHDGIRICIGLLKDGVYTNKGTLYLGRDTKSITTTSEVNAIRWDYPNGATGDIKVTINELRVNYGTVDCGYKPYRAEPITYPIPEALQGTGKGVEGAADTVDFESGKFITRCKTTKLGTVNYSEISQPFSGFVRGFYYIKDFDIALRTKALCSHLPITTVFNGSAEGVCLQNLSSGNNYISVAIPKSYLTDVSGDTIPLKFKNWLLQNNVTLTYALAEPTSEPLPNSTFVNLPEVEGGGSLEFITDSGFAPNSTVMYQTIV